MYVIVYFGAFISKLNYDFFNPALSCGTALYRDLVRTVPILPTGEVVNLFVIWGTMLIELVMPLCFSFRRTWKYGLIIGLSFHIILGLAGHRCFSIQAYAVYFLFLSPAFTEVINDWWPRVRAALGKWTSPLRVGVLILVLALLGLEIIGPPALRAMVFFRYNRMLLWLFWSFVVMGIFAAGIYRSSRMPATMPVPRPRLGFLWLMPLLAALNGMTQYLGLKTEHSFTMFSNLRTEAGVNNHFFMPSWLKLTNWDSDVVGIIASDRSDFEYYHDHDLLLTYFEFRRVASELQGDFQVEYMHHGERRRLIVKDGVSNEPEVTHAPPVWMAKLLRFRPISKSTCSECFH